MNRDATKIDSVANINTFASFTSSFLSEEEEIVEGVFKFDQYKLKKRER